MTLHQFIGISIFICLSTAGFGQTSHPDWSQLMHDKNVSFQEVQTIHNELWPQRPAASGQGFKQFERYKWLYESRVKDNGQIPLGEDIYRIWQELNAYNQSRSLTGNWHSLGPLIDDVTTHEMIQGVGRTSAVAFHPTDPNIIFAGAPAGGIWRTENAGQTWTTNTDMLPTLGISSIVFDPLNPEIIYAGTGDRDANDAPGMGVIKSIDGGDTWTFANDGLENETVGCLRIQPGTNYLFAGTDDGIFRSIDNGLSWELKSPNSGTYKDFEFHPTNAQIMYATSSGKFFRSIDGGEEWDWVSAVLGSNVRMCIAVTPAAPDVVYVLRTGTYAFSGFYRSEDSGATFAEMSDSPNIMGWAADGSSTGGQAWYDLCLEADHENPDIVYAGGIRVKKSLDAGVTWIDVNPNYLHVDQHEMVISPHNSDLYLCNDGGFYQYLDNIEWRDISNGMVIGQIYQLGQSNHNPNHTLTGYQDNGTMEYDGVYWHRRGGGDGFECAYDFSTTNYRYGSIYYGDIYRTTPEVVNEKICGDEVLEINEEGAWNTPYLLHKSDLTANTMFVGLKNVWRSFNIKAAEKDSIVWQKISDNLVNNTTNINEMEICLSNPNIAYVSKDNRHIFRSNNALSESPTWQNLSSDLPVFTVPVNAIETNPIDSNIVYICFHNDVYRSTDQGESWTLMTTTLPDVSTNTLVLDTTNPGLEALYLGTDMGVYYTDTTMTEFISFGNGMPMSSRVTELEIFYGSTPSQHRLKASTYGRGLWEGDLYSAETNNFPAVAAITTADGSNEAYGPFDVNILFYKSLNETDVTTFDDIANDIWIENGTVQNISGGPSLYTATIMPQNYGVIRMMVPEGAAIDQNLTSTFESDTLELVYSAAPTEFGPFGPGGVGDENSTTFWLRADRATILNGNQVANWVDVSGSFYSAEQSQPEKMPTLVTGAAGINGNPALSFDGVDDMLQMTHVNPGRSISAFVMVETDTIKFNDHGWFASSRMPNGYLMHPWKDDYYYHNEVIDLNGDYSGTNSFYIGDASAPHIYGFIYHQDDLHQVMTTIFDDVEYPQPGVDIGARDSETQITIDIGHDSGFDDRYGKGRIAEHFVYSKRLMDTHAALVTNYMASKYGIDLGPDARYHHIDQNQDVIGIGRETVYDFHDDAQGLGVFRIMNPSSLDNGDYLLIGNDMGTLDLINNSYPFLTPRTERTWGFSETGDVGEVKMRLTAPEFIGMENIGLIITEDNEFMAGSSVTFVPLLIQGPVLEATYDFPSNGVFTIGSEPELGVDDYSVTTFQLYPNPTNDILNIELKKGSPKVYDVIIRNSLGQIVQNKKQYNRKTQLDIRELNAGIYTLDVVIEGVSIELKSFVKLN